MPRHPALRRAATAIALAAAASASLAQSPPPGITVAGVNYEPELTLAGKRLQLNGAGIRSKAFFKVYAAALYLPARAGTPAAVYQSAGPKRLKVNMLRDLDSASFGKTMTDVMNDNLPRERMSRCVPGLVKLGEVFAARKRIGAGEHYTIDEIPGKGTVVAINGATVAEIAEPEFFTCLMHNYFGEKPADGDLKVALLGAAGK